MRRICFRVVLLSVGMLFGVLLAPSIWLLFSTHEKTCLGMTLVASFKNYSLYVGPDDQFVLYRGNIPIISEILWQKDRDVVERTLYSPFPDGPYLSGGVCNITFNKTTNEFTGGFFSLLASADLPPDREYVYWDTNGDGFFDSLGIIVDSKRVDWVFSLNEVFNFKALPHIPISNNISTQQAHLDE